MQPHNSPVDESGSPHAMRKRKPEPVSLTLAQVEQELEQLFRYREDLEESGAAMPGELAAIDNQIDEYCKREVAKVDGIAYAIRVYEMAAKFAKSEGARNYKRGSAMQARADRLRENSIRVLESIKDRRVETPLNVLRMQTNGGPEPAPDIHDPELVPNEYCEYLLTLPAAKFDALLYLLERHDYTDAFYDLRDAAKRRVVPELVRSALKQMVSCRICGGRVVAAGSSDDCSGCNGKGLIPATVPGATLSPRGEHLRVE